MPSVSPEDVQLHVITPFSSWVDRDCWESPTDCGLVNCWAPTGTADNGNDLAFIQTFSSRWIHGAQQNLQLTVQLRSQTLPSARRSQLPQRSQYCWGSQSTLSLQQEHVLGLCTGAIGRNGKSREPQNNTDCTGQLETWGHGELHLCKGKQDSTFC